MARAILLYDADCGFCRWSATRILAWDRTHRLRAVPLQSEEADQLLHAVEPERRPDSWHLVVPGGVFSGGAAVSPLARLLPRGAPLARLAETSPRLTDRAYRWVASHRDELGRALGTRACAVKPSAERALPSGPQGRSVG